MAYKGYATGWFAVGFSTELSKGESKPIKYFGKDLVLFRGEDGQARILDAFCPHLGAHLGHGGKVVDNSIRCPFHFWRFDGQGECVEVPYAQKIPAKAKIECWTVQERNGVIMVWHDWKGGAPTYEVPVIPEYGTPDWLPWKFDNFRVKTHPREIIENLADKAHFLPVHRSEILEFNMTIDGVTATQIAKGNALFGPNLDKKERYNNRTTYYGPCFQITQMEGILKNYLLVLTTPVDENYIDLRFAITLKKFGTDAESEQYMEQYKVNLKNGFLEDQAIWENKVWREQPVLCDGDGPIGKLRHWYSQFYEPA